MHALLATWLLVGAAEAPPTTPEVGSEAPAAAAPAPEAEPGFNRGAIGLGLAGGGAVLATGTVVASTLIEALNTPDQEGQPRNERVIQASGLLATGLVSVGGALMLTGGALMIEDLLFGQPRAPASATPSE